MYSRTSLLLQYRLSNMDLPNPRVCEICSSETLNDLYPTEMMHGESGPFHYVHCQECGTIYQPERLEDYSQYYAETYYSFRYHEPKSWSDQLRQFKRRHRNRYYYFGKGFLGFLLARARPCPVNHLAQNVKLRPEMSILEIGSGSGELLHEIADIGVRKAIGIDPFVPQDVIYKNGARVYKSNIQELASVVDKEKFDLIMFNHSIEHSPTPFNDLIKISQYLKTNGEILIRIPISGSTISNEYGKYWWSLDAPRHIYLFSAKSMTLVAKKCGLRVTRTHYEGTIDDFLASEQHKAGIALLAPKSYVITKDFSAFSQKDIKKYETAIAEQNRLGTAAQAGFILSF